MKKCQNGWPVVGPSAIDNRPIAGVSMPNGVLKGDVRVVLNHVAERYSREVENLQHPGCWGYVVKKIEGSAEYSNHAGGCAIDLDAPHHPMGRPASASMTTNQIHACERIVADMDGVVRWGGGYTHRPDPMHWEIVGTPAEVAALARKINGKPAPGAGGGDIMSKLPTLKQGATGDPVKRVQWLADLLLGGADVKVDGGFGAQTTAIVKRAQAAAHLTQDGIVGPATWAVLLGVKP